MNDFSCTCTAQLLTSPRAGAIAVIRIHGADALDVTRRIFEPIKGWKEKIPHDALLLGRIVDENETLDDAMIAIQSCGNNLNIDFSVHGGVRVVERVLMLLERNGVCVQAANPTEPSVGISPGLHQGVHIDKSHPFDLHSDILYALSRAPTRRGIRLVAQQRGLLPVELRRIADLLENAPASGRRALESLIERSRPMPRLIDGVTVALFGPPNAGKSTLINQLSERQGSLVSPVAGTTRDWVDAHTAIEGVPVCFIDTAGAHDGADALENEAVRRGVAQYQKADLQLIVLDGSVPFPTAFFDRHGEVVQSGRAIFVVNKCDLDTAWNQSECCHWDGPTVRISALTGDGIADVTHSILDFLSIAKIQPNQACLFSRRQIEWISQVLSGEDPAAMAAEIRFWADTDNQVILGSPSV